MARRLADKESFDTLRVFDVSWLIGVTAFGGGMRLESLENNVIDFLFTFWPSTVDAVSDTSCVSLMTDDFPLPFPFTLD